MFKNLINKLKSKHSPILNIILVLILIEAFILAQTIKIAFPIALITRIFALALSATGLGLVIWRNTYRQKHLSTFDKQALQYMAPILSGIFAIIITIFYIFQSALTLNNLSIITILGIATSTFTLAYGILCENTKPSSIKAMFVIFTPTVLGLILALVKIPNDYVFINILTIVAIAIIIKYLTSKPHVAKAPETKL